MFSTEGHECGGIGHGWRKSAGQGGYSGSRNKPKRRSTPSLWAGGTETEAVSQARGAGSLSGRGSHSRLSGGRQSRREMQFLLRPTAGSRVKGCVGRVRVGTGRNTPHTPTGACRQLTPRKLDFIGSRDPQRACRVSTPTPHYRAGQSKDKQVMMCLRSRPLAMDAAPGSVFYGSSEYKLTLMVRGNEAIQRHVLPGYCNKHPAPL